MFFHNGRNPGYKDKVFIAGLCNHRAGSHRAFVPYHNSRQDDASGTQPASVPYHNVTAYPCARDSVTVRSNKVRTVSYIDAWSYVAVGTYDDC